MKNQNNTSAYYVVRILMALTAFAIAGMLLTSIISGTLALLALALIVFLILFSITGFKKLKSMF